MAEHLCVPRCKQIVAEQMKGQTFRPVWNSLSHTEQAEWLAQEHEWRIVSVLHRAMHAARIFFGATLALLCWLAPGPADRWLQCDGTLESNVTFAHSVGGVRVVGSQPCDSADPEAGTCPIYARDLLRMVADVGPCATVPTLGLGEVVFVRTTVFDASGNPDCGQ